MADVGGFDNRRGGTGERPMRAPLLVDAELRPHRSLGPTGFLVLMGCVSLVCFAAGAVFLIAGAWPVLGFFGLDVVLIWLAFRLNYRSGRLVERVRLSPSRLDVERIAPSGRVRRWSFQPYWLTVSLDAPGEHHSRLTLSGRGQQVAIGRFLTPEERRGFHRVLTDALARLRGANHPGRPSTSRMS